MENLEAILAEWKTAEPTIVRRNSIKTDEALQARLKSVLRYEERAPADSESAAHVATMRNVLQLCSSHELEPVLVADVSGVLYVVDGHHRLRAYKDARRPTIPARVKAMEWKTAVVLSKIVNTQGHYSLRPRDQQRQEAA